MIRSMTAFAACERAATGGTLGCELRAVNHRFHELALRLPEELRAIEPALRERVAQKVSRGKIDLVMRFRPAAGGRAALRLNGGLLDQLARAAHDLEAGFPALRTEFTELLRWPGVVEEDAIDHAGLQAEALALLDETLAEFVAAREREGEKLAAVMRERVDGIERIATQVRGWPTWNCRSTRVVSSRRSRSICRRSTSTRNSTGWEAMSPKRAACSRCPRRSAAGSIS